MSIHVLHQVLFLREASFANFTLKIFLIKMQSFVMPTQTKFRWKNFFTRSDRALKFQFGFRLRHVLLAYTLWVLKVFSFFVRVRVFFFWAHVFNFFLAILFVPFIGRHLLKCCISIWLFRLILDFSIYLNNELWLTDFIWLGSRGILEVLFTL